MDALERGLKTRQRVFPDVLVVQVAGVDKDERARF
jgi:hypothetical protein